MDDVRFVCAFRPSKFQPRAKTSWRLNSRTTCPALPTATPNGHHPLPPLFYSRRRCSPRHPSNSTSRDKALQCRRSFATRLASPLLTSRRTTSRADGTCPDSDQDDRKQFEPLPACLPSTLYCTKQTGSCVYVHADYQPAAYADRLPTTAVLKPRKIRQLEGQTATRLAATIVGVQSPARAPLR